MPLPPSYAWDRPVQGTRVASPSRCPRSPSTGSSSAHSKRLSLFPARSSRGTHSVGWGRSRLSIVVTWQHSWLPWASAPWFHHRAQQASTWGPPSPLHRSDSSWPLDCSWECQSTSAQRNHLLWSTRSQPLWKRALWSGFWILYLPS